MSSSGDGEERITAMECCISSASEGPPLRREERASEFRGRDGCCCWGWSEEGWEAEEFSILHFRRSLRPGSFIIAMGLYLV